MKVIVPHTGSKSPFLPAVRLALDLEGLTPEYYELRGDADYYDLFYEIWGLGEPFIIVEHDIIPWPGALEQLWECPNPWCVLPYYSAAGWLERGLGCSKFNPQQLSLDIPTPAVWGKGWRTVDRIVAHKLGWEPHLHLPGVTHLQPALKTCFASAFQKAGSTAPIR